MAEPKKTGEKKVSRRCGQCDHKLAAGDGQHCIPRDGEVAIVRMPSKLFGAGSVLAAARTVRIKAANAIRSLGVRGGSGGNARWRCIGCNTRSGQACKRATEHVVEVV